MIFLTSFGLFCWVVAGQCYRRARSSLRGRAALGERSAPAFRDFWAILAVISGASLLIAGVIIGPWWAVVLVCIGSALIASFIIFQADGFQHAMLADVSALPVPVVAAIVWWSILF